MFKMPSIIWWRQKFVLTQSQIQSRSLWCSLARLKVAWMKGSHQVIYKIWTGLLLLLQTLFQNYICHSESQNPSHLNHYSENASVLKISQLGAKNPYPGVLRMHPFLYFWAVPIEGSGRRGQSCLGFTLVLWVLLSIRKILFSKNVGIPLFSLQGLFEFK